MKRHLLNIVFPMMMAWLMVMPLPAQRLTFGVKGGLEVMNMEFNDNVFDKSNRAGAFIGPTFIISTPVPGLSIDISGLYSQRTLKVEDESIKQRSIQVPAHARYGASIPEFGSVYLCAGPQLSFNVGPSKYFWEDAQENAKQFLLQDTKFAADFGLGVRIGDHLEADVYYSIPIGKTADVTWGAVEDAAKQAAKVSLSSVKTKANSWLLSIAYLF